MTPSAKLGQALATTIEQIKDKGVVVAQPTLGGSVRQLARYEPLRICFSVARGKLSGETRTLSRTKIESGGQEPFYGYLLEKPKALHVIDRRQEMRMLFGGDLVYEAELKLLDRAGPLLGLLEDISPSGASMRCRNTSDILRRGKQANLKLELPEPVGTVNEVVTIVEVVDAEGGLLVRVVFPEKNRAIAHAMNMAQGRFGQFRKGA